MKKKILLVVLVLAFVCLCIAKGCFPRKYVVVDCEPREVQSIVAEVNSGIGEGTYDKILIFHGKDPFLSSSCVVSTNEWLSRMLVLNHKSRLVMLRLLSGVKLVYIRALSILSCIRYQLAILRFAVIFPRMAFRLVFCIGIIDMQKFKTCFVKKVLYFR